MTKHGKSRHPAYNAWNHARSRCTNPKDPMFKTYGARGITFPSEWATFAAFWEDMGESWQRGLTLDRADNNKGYSKGNCRWTTQATQAANKTTNRVVHTKKFGSLHTAELARRAGISHSTLFNRLKSGCPEHLLFRKGRLPNYSKPKL